MEMSQKATTRTLTLVVFVWILTFHYGITATLPDRFAVTELPDDVTAEELGTELDPTVTDDFATVEEVTIGSTAVTERVLTTIADLRPLECVELPRRRHGDLVILEDFDRPLTEGTSVTLRCHPGYSRVGPDRSTCRHGRWEPQLWRMKCLADCRQPKPIRWGVFVESRDRHRHRDEVSIRCDEGFERVGPPASVCRNGRWFPPPFHMKCVSKLFRYICSLYISQYDDDDDDDDDDDEYGKNNNGCVYL
ncbi:uncharacterized protein [Ptychodera flava]|uniref:uncharacterized protein n=1 Tax=Ptychodera flava TaxID=63121 RepID=UPI003969EF8C